MSTIVTVNVNSHFRIYEAKIMKINLNHAFQLLVSIFFQFLHEYILSIYILHGNLSLPFYVWFHIYFTDTNS